MPDSSAADTIPTNPNLATDFDPLPIPPLDHTFFSGLGEKFDCDLDDFDFTFDDLDLPSDTEDFLNPLPSPIAPFASDPLLFSTDRVSGINSGCFEHVSGDQSSSGAKVLNSPSPVPCELSWDQCSDVAKFLNLSSPESSQESGNKREVSAPGNSGSPVSETLNYLSPDSSGSPNSANNSRNGGVDRKIKLEEGGGTCLLKRKKGSEDANSELRTSKYRRSTSAENTDPLCGSDSTGEDDVKRKARLMRNRESAQLSRQRKKHYVEELEDKVRSMHSTIQDLNSKMSYVMAENASLRQQLSSGAACPPGPVPPTSMSMYPHMHIPPMGYPWMACPPYAVKQQGSQVPLVPIPRLKPHQAASVPRTKKNEGRTKKVASVSFLGLLLFILFFGGLVPMVNVKFGGMRGSASGGSDYLGKGFYEMQRGRVLSVNGHLNGSDQSNSSEPLVASLYVPRNDKLVKIDGNLIIHSVMASEKAMASHQDPGKKSSKETGLVVPGNMTPAIPIAGRNNGRHPNAYKSPSEHRRALGRADKDIKSTATDGQLQQWFKEGLAGPMLTSGMCTEVFQFDVSPSPGAIVAAASIMNVSGRRNLTDELVKGQNRRILHGIPIPFGNDSSKEHVDRNGKKEDGGFRGNNNTLSSMVVSVLVDPREAGDGEGDGVMGPKSYPRIFVVVLIDSVKYVTYSCMLPLKGSGALV